MYVCLQEKRKLTALFICDAYRAKVFLEKPRKCKFLFIFFLNINARIGEYSNFELKKVNYKFFFFN